MTIADPDLEVQTGIIAKLKADAGVLALLGGMANVFDSPPGTPPSPYITVGDGQTVPDLADNGYDGADVYVNVHVWSRRDGDMTEAKLIAAAVKASLGDGTQLVVDGSVRVVQMYPMARHDLRDPDGQTAHIVLMFCAFTEPA